MPQTKKDPRELRRQAAAKRDEAQTIHEDTLKKSESERAEGLAAVNTLAGEARSLLAEAKQLESEETRANEADATRNALSELSDQLDARGGDGASGDGSDPGPAFDRRNTRNGLHNYSLMRAVRGWTKLDGAEFDGIEREQHQHMRSEALGRGNRAPFGFYAPSDRLGVTVDAAGAAARTALGREARDALSTVTGAGALVTTTYASMIEYLRASLVVRRLGARILTGLVGTIQIPRKTGTGQHYWIAEGNAPTVSNVTIGQVGLSPHTIGARQQYTRQFLLQTGIDAEMFLRADLTETLAEGIDRAALDGSGVDPEPEGILQNAAVPTLAFGTNGGVPTWALLVAMETALGAANAMSGTPAYLVTWPVRGKLKTSVMEAGTPAYLWEVLTNTVNGYPAESTTLLPTDGTKGTGTNLSAIIFGVWQQMILGFWSGVDILVNPYYPLGQSGGVELVALQDTDIAIRQPTAFIKSLDVVTA